MVPIVDLPALAASFTPVAFGEECAVSAEATLVAAVGGVVGEDDEEAATEVVVLVWLGGVTVVPPVVELDGANSAAII